MRKMVLLAVMMALAAMMLAAAPASAQNVSTSFFDRGDDGLVICDFDDDDGDDNDECEDLAFIICDFDDDDGDDFDECEDVNVVRDFDFEDGIFSQETEQEAESGDIDQSFDVSQTGDNSNQTVSTQGVANTGNAQNVIDVVDAGDFGDFDNDGFVFCDRDRDGKDDGDDDCFVIFPDFNDGFFNDGDRVFVNDGNNDDGDIEIEDSGAEITMSPNNTTNSSQQVNQAAAASAPHWVWTGSEWMWM